MSYNHLEIREIFHVEFLRKLFRSIDPSTTVLKGGTNLRLFFNSTRYSEDMDLDVKEIPVHVLNDKVMSLLNSKTFKANLKSFGIEEIIPPNITKAKQTETVQRFKVHILTSSGEDLFTKLEFSRRGFDKSIKAEAVSPVVLNKYKLPPLIIPHYLIESVIRQKTDALLKRKVTQARDIFDLYILSTQVDFETFEREQYLGSKEIEAISQRIYQVSYPIYRDTVVSYLDIDEQQAYNSLEFWDEIRLEALKLIEKGRRKSV